MRDERHEIPAFSANSRIGRYSPGTGSTPVQSGDWRELLAGAGRHASSVA